jgi:formylglycine-generating enzyme required for sulfatase activity
MLATHSVLILTIGALLLPSGASAQAGSAANKTENDLLAEFDRVVRQVGPDNWETAIALGNLARFYRGQKRFSEAAPFYENALAIAKKTQRENSSLAVALTQELASVYRALKRTAEADRLGKVADAASRVPEPGATKVNSKDGLPYVWIPPGQFVMGCSPGDSDCFDWEKPAHGVTISKGFWIGRTDVTQGAYQHVVGTNPSHFKGANRPVEQVTWNEALSYCQAVGMRLPTEAE